MVGNGDKTKAMLITTYQKESKLPKKELTIFFNNTQLKNVNSSRYIGENINTILNILDYTEAEDIISILIAIDVEKAFDYLEWSFIFKVLEQKYSIMGENSLHKFCQLCTQ